ncbi:MAG: hypothetical protein IT423_16175, partial [Pirellulaceae bacterium]|nr:hypothetical protein [Pirellulaceae bacterium]
MSRKSRRRSARLRGLSSNIRRRTLFEQLEQRQLLAIDLIYPSDLTTLPTADLRLQGFLNGSTPSVRLVAGSSTIVSGALTADSIVNIRRDDSNIEQLSNASDTIRVDLDSLSTLQSFIAANTASNSGRLTVNFNGGDPLPLVNTLFGDDSLVLEAAGSAASPTVVNFGLSVITTADILVDDVNANVVGDLLLRSNPTSNTTGDATDLSAFLETMSAEVRIENSRLNATNLTIDATATKTMLVTPDSAFGGNLTFAEAILDGSSEVTIIGGVIVATNNLSINAQSTINTTVGRNPANDGNANDNDQQQDAAVVLTTINNPVTVNINTGAILTAGGLATILANNSINAVANADGTAGSSDAGGTVAVTTITGSTEILVSGNSSITSVGNLSLTANSNRVANATANATPRAVTGGGGGTAGTNALGNNARTPSGNMNLAAAIAVSNLSGDTLVDVNNATLISSAGNLTQLADAKYTFSTLADASTANGNSSSGIGAAVALQNVSGDAISRVRGTSTLDGNQININARIGDTGGPATVTLDATSGPTGSSSSSDLNLAGAVAININTADARAYIGDRNTNNNPVAANVNASSSNVNLSATMTTTDTVRATPKQPASAGGSGTGAGASFALNIVDHVTEARLLDQGQLSGATSLTLNATANNTKNTTAQAGAKGGTAIAGALAMAIVTEDTLASIGSGSVLTLTGTGNLTATADHTSVVNTTGQGDATTGTDSNIAAVMTLSYVNETTETTINRNLSAPGNLTFLSTNASRTTGNTTANAQGASSSAAGSSNTNSASGTATTSAGTTASNGGARGPSSTGTQSRPTAATSRNSIDVSAAVTVNIVESFTRSYLPQNRLITASGVSSIRSLSNVDVSGVANAATTQAGDWGVGVGVALNYANINNEAYIDA